MFQTMHQFGYLITFGFVTLSPATVTGRFCEGGHRCTAPRECCAQGCCFLYAPPSAPRTPQPATDHVLNLFFVNHWYLWCVIVTIILLSLLCACSLWRKRRQLCGWGTPVGTRSQSEGDSAGSCFAPPQYSRCNSFHHHAPPPYTEVTSKPDLYPLVFTCNGSGSDAAKNGASYLMVQYFRNYIVRPAMSATSTVDSLSSSFMCNGNDSNTLVPPTYSRAASPDLPNNIMPRSASQQACTFLSNNIVNSHINININNNNNNSNNNNNNNINNSHNNNTISCSIDDVRITKHLNNYIPVSLSSIGNSINCPTRNNVQMTMIRASRTTAELSNINSTQQRMHQQDCRLSAIAATSASASALTPMGAPIDMMTERKNTALRISESVTFGPMQIGPGNIGCSVSAWPEWSRSDQQIKRFSIQSAVPCIGKSVTMNNADFREISGGNGGGGGSSSSKKPPIASLNSAESPVNVEAAKKYEGLRGHFGAASNTGSEVSSLTNIGSLGSPPRATSPTDEVKELLEQIRALQSSAPDSPDDRAIAVPGQLSASAPRRPSTLHTSRRKLFMSKATRAFYVPVREQQTFVVQQPSIASGRSMALHSPSGYSALLSKARGRRVSKSAPTTPGANNTGNDYNVADINDQSPLLLDAHDEEDGHV